VKDSYHRGVTDEFIVPFVCVGEQGEPIATIRDEDVCINFNFRADRARQITRVLARNSGLTKNDGRELPDADVLDKEIPRNTIPKDLKYVCMTQYDKEFTLPIVVPPQSMNNILANVMADAHLRNLRVAETEKYAHVTYFFNGGVEKEFSGEDRILVPSQKVATYDLAPEMSAQGIADTVVKAIADRTFDVIIVNFANADMVGHSGKIAPTVRGVEKVDDCLGQISAALRRVGGSMIVTADHGNAEMMIDPATGGPHTAHTTNPVPFIMVSEDANRYALKNDGALQDISPTVLGMLGLPQPKEMLGHDLRLKKG
jgi:2,3-bisphosphoglycerate-independent phosphoglycerate mutase